MAASSPASSDDPVEDVDDSDEAVAVLAPWVAA
jgi:hypothetical protein